MVNLANLNLRIDFHADPTGDWIQLRLEDNWNMSDAALVAEIDYPLSYNTPNKEYHFREGLVIAMRRLVSQAAGLGLISLREPKTGVAVEF